MASIITYQMQDYLIGGWIVKYRGMGVPHSPGFRGTGMMVIIWERGMGRTMLGLWVGLWGLRMCQI